MQSEAKSVAQYLAALPVDRKAALGKLRALIKQVAPEAQETMAYRMPTYELHGLFCAFASQKNYLALYLCEPKVVAAYRRSLGKLDCGKSCLRFRRLAELPLEVIQRMLEEIRALRLNGEKSGQK